MIASLMMYERAELTAAHARFWALIRSNLTRAGLGAPDNLSQSAEEFNVWTDPDLVLSQTCGMPFRMWLHDRVELVGTPDYGLVDCPQGYYRSALVVRAGDERMQIADYKDALFAFNQTFSQSGFAAAYWHVKPHGFWFHNRIQTGGHVLSAKAVAEGRADLAAIDAVTLRNIQRYDEFGAKLRVLEWTTPTPGLPLITAKGQDRAALQRAVAAAIAELSAPDAQSLGIQGIVDIPKEDYLAVPNPPDDAGS